ncbi:uncharacterized protein LOC107492886 [Arachis duranensis]|uniref:Uncharacterized protein LOC107492886 n=1 Tax=Arachis duranensis TaxID=130453 RepID=A0A9C6WK47_ARADU|nr:uncharacterized protein LOC107492886 [Arachis duranensis]
MDQKIEHFSHVHPLLLKEDHKNEDDGMKLVSCSACEEQISGPSYSCKECNYILHKSCIELPLKLKHPLHPQHPLTLLSTPPYDAGYFCDACRGTFNNGFVYHCSLCTYDLDISCASTWHPDDGHVHAFISLNSLQPFVCYACGGEAGEGSASFCTACQIWVHCSCAELPHTIIKHFHHHPLQLTYSLNRVYGFRDDITCGVCHGTMSSGFAGYYCSDCRFPMHLKCPAKQEEDFESDTEEEKDHEDETLALDKDKESNVDFGHNHLLTLIEELSLEFADKLCDGCVQAIAAPPLYSCSENCGFLLHKSCAELPRTKQHRFHPHPLTLHSKAPSYDGIYRCDSCKSLSNGFVYRCDECQFDLDVRCGTLEDKVKHESHKHPLSVEKTNIARECKCCHSPSKYVLVCDVCDDFAIDCGCANLPSKIWNKCDKHVLSLIYNGQGKLMECNNCGICREIISPKKWLYYCEECDFGAHPSCVVDKSCSSVKFGGTFQYDAHSHPLALVEETGKHPPPPCEACGDGCKGWTLECEQCKCYFHREGQCFWEQLKKSSQYLTLSRTMRHKFAANVLAATPNVTDK